MTLNVMLPFMVWLLSFICLAIFLLIFHSACRMKFFHILEMLLV